MTGKTFTKILGNILGRYGWIKGSKVSGEDSSTRNETPEIREQLEIALEAAEMVEWDYDYRSQSLSRSLRHDRFFGYAEMLPAWSADDFFKHVVPEHHQHVKKSLADPSTDGSINLLFRIRRVGGSLRWALLTGKIICHEKGERLRAVGILQDVTGFQSNIDELYKVREQIQIEKQKFEALFAVSPDSMALLRGPEQVIEMANPAFLGLFTNRKLLGRRCKDAVPEFLEQNFSEEIEKTFDTGLRFVGKDMRAVFPSGPDGGLEDRYFDLAYTRINDHDGKPYGVYLHGIDVTEKVLARQCWEESEARLHIAKEVAETANHAKSLFLANMSHEIRTPLGAILGFLDILKSPTNSRKDNDGYIQAIERNSQQLLRTVEAVLDLSEVEGGKLEIENSEFSLLEMLGDFSKVMGSRAHEKGMEYEMRYKAGIPDWVRSDATRIRQTLDSVVGNALKFTDRGYVWLTVSFRGSLLTFTVEDTGKGIAVDQIPSLFQPFTQVDSSSTRSYGGAGLGLFLSRRWCEGMGGSFVLEKSNIGVGSTFVASFKVETLSQTKLVGGEALAAPPCTAEMGGEEHCLSGMRILVVEDSLDNQEILNLFLQRWGASLEIASNGLEGLEMATQKYFDVVIMDIQMPFMDGHEVTRRLRASGYRRPIVALTAHALREERDRCFESGFSSFLSKPIQKNSLRNLLQTYRVLQSRTKNDTVFNAPEARTKAAGPFDPLREFQRVRRPERP